MLRSLMMSATSWSCSRVERARVVEVEAQLIGADVRALLAGALAEHVLQRAVQQMGGGVMAARPIAPHGVSTSACASSPTRTTPPSTCPKWTMWPARVEVRVVDDEDAARRADPAGVADLAAALRDRTARLRAPGARSSRVSRRERQDAALRSACRSRPGTRSAAGRRTRIAPVCVACAQRPPERARWRSCARGPRRTRRDRTSRPCFAQHLFGELDGKPYVWYRSKTRSPLIVVWPTARASAIRRSICSEPAWSVRLNSSSSSVRTCLMRAASVTRSG